MEAGVPHVVCIDQNEVLIDHVAIEFSNIFYDEVFDEYMNICDAFQFAKEKIQQKFDKFQAKKIMLLTNTETHGEKCPEQDDHRLKKIAGEMRQIGVEWNLMQLPNKVSPFLSRNQDMFEVLSLLSSNNIVQIYGMPGLGKSALLKNVTCYLAERDIYKDGVIYIDFMHVLTFKETIQIFNVYLKDLEEDQFYQSFNQDEFSMEIERLKLRIQSF
jgi:Cdc6-like AAA superfamily ATPase